MRPARSRPLPAFDAIATLLFIHNASYEALIKGISGSANTTKTLPFFGTQAYLLATSLRQEGDSDPTI
jgi:hypothetical protein